MNKQLNLPQLQKIMQEFQEETEKMGLTEEVVVVGLGSQKSDILVQVMGDTIDDVLGEVGDEEEEEAIVGQVLEEIGVDMNEVLANAPGSALPAGNNSIRSQVRSHHDAFWYRSEGFSGCWQENSATGCG